MVKSINFRNKMKALNGGVTDLPNRLWQARKRRGLGQKQVSILLNHKQIDQLSRFEQGSRVPNLHHALMLEILYGVPVRLLFHGLYEQLQAELREKAGRSLMWPVIDEAGLAATGEEEFCMYQELLRSPLLTPVEKDRVRRHVAKVARQLAYL